jgi:hypothetical protein
VLPHPLRGLLALAFDQHRKVEARDVELLGVLLGVLGDDEGVVNTDASRTPGSLRRSAHLSLQRATTRRFALLLGRNGGRLSISAKCKGLGSISETRGKRRRALTILSGGWLCGASMLVTPMYKLLLGVRKVYDC